MVLTPQLAAGQKLCRSHMWVTGFFFVLFAAFKSVPNVPAGFPANQKDGTSKTDELPISLLRSISAPLFPLPVSSLFLSYLFTSMRLFFN